MSEPSLPEESIFAQALEIESATERAAFLNRACGDNASLRADVEALLRVSQRSGDLLDLSENAAITADLPARERPGAVIGPYKLLELIGEGGMGSVWMAEQTEPIQRRVAVKVVKEGMDSKQVLARFEAERQALALMEHPNIAKVLDAGRTPSGRPYFVMELVKGQPITKYCDEKRLGVRERLELFGDVCRAVQHAHQKGIIHRDLKPSNVLVAPFDGRPVVKVIDFGVAKATGQRLTDKTLFTGFGALVGTPEYMSPEQAEVNNQDIDTRSDVYSLGVLLYELLTGSTPLTRKRVQEAAILEVLRVIREEEPPRPSTRLSSTDELPSISAQRHTEPAKLTKLVRGELDWIVMKALEKDRNRRYETANGFAMDVQRYLADEPVQACPPSAWYRFRKVARRHKTAMFAAAGIVLALTGIAASIGWAVRDRGAREELLDQTVARSMAEVIEPLLADEKWSEALAAVNRADALLAAAGRTERPQRLVQLRDELGMVERLEAIPKVKGLAKTLAGGPEHRPQEAVFSEQDYFTGRQPDEKFAEVFRDFGIDVNALTPEKAAAEIQRRSVHPALVEALDEWAPLRRSARGEKNEGWKKLVAIARLADPDPWRNRCREAFLQRDRQALEQLAQTVPIRQVTPKTLWLLGVMLKEVGALDRALELLRKAQHAYPDDLLINDSLGSYCWSSRPPRTEDALRYYSIALSLRPIRPQLHFMVAVILGSKGAIEDAVVEYSRALELDPKYAPARDNLCGALWDQGKFEEVIAIRRKAIELDPKDAVAHNSLASALSHQKKLDEAIAEFRRAIALDPKDARTHENLASVLSQQKKHDEAIAEYRRAIELDPKSAWIHSRFGRLLISQQRWDEGLAEYRKAIGLEPKATAHHFNLGLALLQQQKLDEASNCFRKTIHLWPKDAVAHYHLGLALSRQKKLDEASAEFRRAIALDPKYLSAHSSLAFALNQQNKLDEAIAVFRRAIDLNPKSAWMHRCFGELLISQQRWDEGLAEYRKAVELEPKEAGHHSDLGLALQQQGKLDEASTEFRKAIELDPKSAWMHNRFGGLLLRQQKWDEGLAEYRKAVELEPKEGGHHSNLGLVLQRQGKLDEAINCFRKAIELDPKFAMARYNLALILNDQKKLDEAIAVFRRGIELDPKSAWMHSRFGGFLLSQQKWDEGLAEYRKAVELEPKKADHYDNLGRALLHHGKLDEAIICIGNAIALDPNPAGYHNNLGLALLRQQKLDEGISCFRKAIALGLNDGTAHRNLGTALKVQGKLDEANAAFDKAIEFDLEWALKTHPNPAVAQIKLGAILSGVIAHYRFRDQGKDLTGRSADFELKNAPFKDSALYLNGVSYDKPGGFHAQARTPLLNYQAFSVLVRFRPADFTGLDGPILMGGRLGRWFGIGRTKNGDLFVSFNDDEIRFDIKNGRLELDKTIEVACSVDAKKRHLIIHVNGKKMEDLALGKDFALQIAQMPWAQGDRIWTFANYGNATAFHGFVEELIVANGILTPAQLRFRVTPP